MLISLKESFTSKQQQKMDELQSKVAKELIRWGERGNKIGSKYINKIYVDVDFDNDIVTIYSDIKDNLLLTLNFEMWDKKRFPKNIILNYNGEFIINPGFENGGNKKYNLIENYNFESKNNNLKSKIFISEPAKSTINNSTFNFYNGDIIYTPSNKIDNDYPNKIVLLEIDENNNFKPFSTKNLEMMLKRLYGNDNKFIFNKLNIGDIVIGVDTHNLPKQGLNDGFYAYNMKINDQIFSEKLLQNINNQIKQTLNLNKVNELEFLDNFNDRTNIVGWYNITYKK